METRIHIFDTTLRDGEQSPGASMDEHEKLQMAAQLERLGVDVIEAGFPIASEQEYQGVRRIAKAVKTCHVAALARAVRPDIERAASALEPAAKPHLHTFIATSDLHLEHKLRMTREQVLENVHNAVSLAKSLVPRVEFSAEDSTRSDWAYLVEVVKVAVAAGADVINLPDTVGYTTPSEIKGMFQHVIANVPGSDKVIFSSHNHNDLGLAVANALAAVEGGARQVECTVSGIGERAGNTSLEEFVMAVHTRHQVYPYTCGINTKELVPSSTLLSKITGLVIPYNKPIVGRNAFAHESGIHQHGMLANSQTYEIMTPESVGRSRSELVLGKHSGRAGLASRAKTLGYELDAEELSQLYDKFIDLADKKKEVFDDDLRMLIVALRNEEFEVCHLEMVRTYGGNPSMALVRIRRGDEPVIEAMATGDGPVDAVCRAIEKGINVEGRLEQFDIRATTPGKEALGEAYVTVQIQGKNYKGNGADTDIVVAAAQAYLNALNKYIALKASFETQEAPKAAQG
ncbi:MAG: 2-isopropylmalate synthase [Candidatus Hydrogenedens sp.]|nr:2-isopropylmalate synthase [Candidatus Hydrogenedens sp.]